MIRKSKIDNREFVDILGEDEISGKKYKYTAKHKREHHW